MRLTWVASSLLLLFLGTSLLFAQDITLPRSTNQVRIVLKCPPNTYWRAWKTVPDGNLIVTCGSVPTERAVELKSR